MFSCSGFRNHRVVIYPASGDPRAHASPAVPEEVESRWPRRGVREPQSGDSVGILARGSLNATSPSLRSHRPEWVSGCGGFSLNGSPGQQGLISLTITHSLRTNYVTHFIEHSEFKVALPLGRAGVCYSKSFASNALPDLTWGCTARGQLTF